MMGYRWVTKAVVWLTTGAWSALSVASVHSFDKDKVLAYWNQPNRYTISTPEKQKGGPWQVRLTPEGSLWLWALNQKRGLGKIFTNPVPRNDEERTWEDWIESKVTYDRWTAALSTNIANGLLGLDPADIGPEPVLPGNIPDGLYRLVGDAPKFALAVEPKQHTVTFHDGQKIVMVDNPVVPNRYPYYRFSQGVSSGGTQIKKMSQDELDGLFSEAGVPKAAQKVMKAVSLLEGGFDAINTYDTGYVSVGFIQFACLSKGSGSLGTVLLREKAANPSNFESDFRQFGIDVKDDGTLLVLGLADGQEYEGFDAAKQIIEDKRLIAVFQRAGQVSRPFRIAQLQVAKDQYYPADETFSVQLSGQSTTVKVSDIVKSEAGLATLMDRKVNTGKITPLATKAQEVANMFGVKSVGELAQFEREIVAGLRLRKSYLDDETLSQPVANARAANLTSRSGTRKGRDHKS